MSIISPKLLSDLEIFEKIIPSVDHTTTIYGSTKLKELIQVSFSDQERLDRRKMILENLIFNPLHKRDIARELKKIKKVEADISWFFNDSESKKDYKDLCFSREYLNNKDVVSVRNFLKIYTPSILLIVYLLIYVIFRYAGIQISIKEYIFGIYRSYQLFISMILSFVVGHGNINSFLTNILSTMYILYQVYTIYNSVDSSMCHYGKCSEFTTHFDKIKQFITSVKVIYKKDKFLIPEKNSVREPLDKIDELLKKSKNTGYLVNLKKTSATYEPDFNLILRYIGTLDALISISKLITNFGYTFPTFDFRKNSPYIDAVGIWLPSTNMCQQVLNDCHLGQPNTMILTGPNTSGKSTYIRNIMLVVLFAQTFGVVPARGIVFTPFDYLFTYIDIPNIARLKESLFEAELMRCVEFTKVLETIDNDKYVFTIIDELFTGTNPKEGVAASYAVCEYIGEFKNSLQIVTTHFHDMCELETEHPDNFVNKKFNVARTETGFQRSYKLEDGRSNQNIAIELLYEKGYNSKIIEKALKKLGE